MESVHNFVLEYKIDCQNESIINNLTKKDDLLNLILMLFKKNGFKEHIPLQKYHSYIFKNNIELKLQRLCFYNEFQCAMNQTYMNIESLYSITNALVSESKKYIIPSRLDVENNNETGLF